MTFWIVLAWFALLFVHPALAFAFGCLILATLQSRKWIMEVARRAEEEDYREFHPAFDQEEGR